MNDVIVRCPSCEQPNRIPADAGSRKVVCGRCRTELRGDPAPVSAAVNVTDAGFETFAAGQAAVIDFWAAWCGPCKQMAPIFDAVAAATEGVRFGKLNVDENPRTAAKFSVQGIPTLLFLKDGRESGRLVGAVNRQQLEQAIARYLS